MSREDGRTLENVLSDRQMHHALHEAARAACVLLHVDASIIFLATEENLRAAAWLGCEADDAMISAHSTSIQAFRAGQRSIAWIQRERCADRELDIILESMGLRSGLAVPLLANGNLIGMWLAATYAEHTFSEADELILHSLAENISLTTKSILLSTENLRYRREADALYEIGTEISQLLDLDQVLEVIVEKVCYLLNAEISYLALADEEAQMIRVRVTWGTRGDALRRLVHKYGEGVGGSVAATRTPLLVDNYPADPRFKLPGIAELLATEGIISAMCVPMCTRRGLVGVLYAASRYEAAFDHSQLNLLQALGTQAAIAIENARLYDEQKVSAEKLRASIITHERLLSLVLGSQGLQAIADTLSDLVHCPIVVENSRFHVLCWSIHGYPEMDQTQMLTLHTSSMDLWQDPEVRGHLDVLGDIRHSIRVPPHPERGVHHSRVVAPIVAGKTLLGYVTALETGPPLNEQQRAAVEQASIVFAIEFLKQEAARANLLHHIIAAQEEERKRIARELHDETSQALTALMVGLDTTGLALAINPQEAAHRLGATKAIAEGMLENIHRLITDLRPSLLDDLGLVPAIAWYGEQRLRPLGIALRLEGNGLEQRLPPTMETALFRIVQEAITNVIRHAKASTVTVRLVLLDDYLTLQVADDGQGFDPEMLQSPDPQGKSLGLWGIRERVSILGGEFHVQTAPGQGTTVTVRVPLAQEKSAHV